VPAPEQEPVGYEDEEEDGSQRKPCHQLAESRNERMKGAIEHLVGPVRGEQPGEQSDHADDEGDGGHDPPADEEQRRSEKKADPAPQETLPSGVAGLRTPQLPGVRPRPYDPGRLGPSRTRGRWVWRLRLRHGRECSCRHDGQALKQEAYHYNGDVESLR
jgi:hypothetical protein